MFPSGSQHTRVYSDKRIEWRPGRLYLPAMCFTGMSVSAINEGGAANDAYGVNPQGLDVKVRLIHVFLFRIV